MKRAEEMEHKELLTLTDKDIDVLVEIEIAHAGIMPVECPAPPDLGSVGIAKDHIAYKVGGLLLVNREDAVTISAMPRLMENYDYNGAGYSYKWLDPVTDCQVEESPYYRQADVVRVQEALMALKNKKDQYEAKKSDYDKFMKATGDCRNVVWDIIDRARGKEQDLALARRTYARHLELADDDTAIATKFFCDAYKNREDIIDSMGFNLPTVVEAPVE